jgi:hypothetical protein
MKTPQALFIWGIITKWYIMILVPTIIATYYVFSGLQSSGVLQIIENFTISKLQLVTRITRDCTPLILNLKQLFRCIQYTR